jgi:glycosyltransferase 2 family protein
MNRSAVRPGPLWPAIWARSKQIAPWALAALVLVLLVRHAGVIDWPQVWSALKQQPLGGLGLAALLALVSHALFSSYDLVGRHETGHKLAVPRTLGIAAVCYAFNLNFGSLVGALAIKLRLYDRAGLKPRMVARIIVLSIVTNWTGYLLVGGLVLLLSPPPMPQSIGLSDLALRAIGGAMVAAPIGYVIACALRHGREMRLRGHRFAMPVLRVALWQLAVSSANWALMGVIVWVLLAQSVPYPAVLGVLLLAAVAGVVTHVPAGLGVLEAVFVACLASEVATPTVLAALLSYRAVYYLVPLALASIGYAAAEVSRRGAQGAPRPAAR